MVSVFNKKKPDTLPDKVILVDLYMLFNIVGLLCKWQTHIKNYAKMPVIYFVSFHNLLNAHYFFINYHNKLLMVELFILTALGFLIELRGS